MNNNDNQTINLETEEHIFSFDDVVVEAPVVEERDWDTIKMMFDEKIPPSIHRGLHFISNMRDFKCFKCQKPFPSVSSVAREEIILISVRHPGHKLRFYGVCPGCISKFFDDENRDGYNDQTGCITCGEPLIGIKKMEDTVIHIERSGNVTVMIVCCSAGCMEHFLTWRTEGAASHKNDVRRYVDRWSKQAVDYRKHNTSTRRNTGRHGPTDGWQTIGNQKPPTVRAQKPPTVRDQKPSAKGPTNRFDALNADE